MNTQGKRFKQLRQNLSKNQEELANVLGIARTSISKLENESGYFEMETYPKLVNILDINLNWLIAGKGEMFIKENAASDSDDLRKIARAEAHSVLKELLHEYGLTNVLKSP